MARAPKTAFQAGMAAAVVLPHAVRLQNVYGFIDDYGDRWHWDAGQIVRHPYVISMLIDRKAPIVLM